MLKKILICTIVLAGTVTNGFETYRLKNNRVDMDFSGTVETYEPIVVLELFTSQGCSSCPAADTLLDEIKNEDHVYALSYHVDYWNYIGWEDPFGSPEHAKKQQKYNQKFHNNSNYTPQLVVNGREHFVGSSSLKVRNAIIRYRKQKSVNKVEVSNMHANEGRIFFDYKILGNTRGKKIRAILVLDRRITKVKSGENRNRTLTNSNIVITQKSIPIIDFQGSGFVETPKIVRPGEQIELIVLVENDGFDITGATKKTIP